MNELSDRWFFPNELGVKKRSRFRKVLEALSTMAVLMLWLALAVAIMSLQ